MDKLTEKQKRFVDYFIETGVATEAARLAGYKGNNLDRIGSENLRKLESYIKDKLESKDNQRIMSQDEVLSTLTKIARGEDTEEVALLCGEGCQELIDKKVGAKDRVKALELLGKRYGTWVDRKEIKHSDTNKLDAILKNLDEDD